jgi:polyhydroxyalkanoate synthesis regulator phasin
MLLSGWMKVEREILQSQVFFHPEDVRIYLWIAGHAAVKDGAVLGDRVLKKGQFVQSISKIRENLYFYSGNKKDEYSNSRIQRSIKRLEKAGLVTTEKFKHGYVFTVREAMDPAGDSQSLDVTGNEGEEADMEKHEKHADIFLPSRLESGLEERCDRVENKKKIVKKVKKEKKKTLTTLTNTMADKLTLITEHFLVRRGGSYSLSPVDQMALEKISLHEMSVDELKAFMDEQFEKIKVHEPNATIHSPKYLLKALERRESPRKRMDDLEEMLDRLEESLKDYDN